MVESVVGRDIVCIAETAGILRSRKGINVPYVSLGTALVTPRDEEMVAFARNNGVDFIGISFVESAAHVEAIRALADDSWPRIVSKVENQGGVEHVDEIVAATDVIMIDRGDLSVETNLETLAVQQKRIIAAAQRAGKPVIVATEMLHTMIENPFPTKAEVSDITNAVLDGCAATMLSGETAVGAYPLEAVSLMRRVSDAAEAYLQDNLTACGRTDQTTVPQVIEDAIALICRSLPVTKIVAVTRSGFAARMISARQVRQPILRSAMTRTRPVASTCWPVLRACMSISNSRKPAPIILLSAWSACGSAAYCPMTILSCAQRLAIRNPETG